MESLEDKLKRALEATDAPEGFVERVMARVEQRRSPAAEPTPQPLARLWFGWLRTRWRLALPGALAGVVLLGIGYWHHQLLLERARQQERVRGEQTSARLLLALKITGTHLSRVHELLLEAPRARTAEKPPAAPDNPGNTEKNAVNHL